MKVVLTGASGLLGPALASSFRGDGHDVLRLVRREPTAADEARWDPVAGTIAPAALDGADVVVHLAGRNLGTRPWTPGHRRAVLDSRVQGTTTIARAVARQHVPTLVSASAIGYYGNPPGDRVLDESQPAGSTYIAQIAAAWEAATAPATEAGSRVVATRTAVVLSARGGAYSRLLPIFRLGLGGRLGSGRQWWSWITLHDYVRAVRFLVDRADISGPVNLSAPEPLTNADMTDVMGRVLHRPTIVVVPGPALKIPLRDFGADLLGGQRVIPRRLLDAGFSFTEPTFEAALRTTLARG